MRLLVYAALVIASLVSLAFIRGEIAIGLLTGTITAFGLPIVDVTVSNFRYACLAFSSLLHYKKRVRVSISYLFRIEINEVYLLVRGSRYSDQFQPVGGVYKFNPSARTIFRQWSVETDDFIPIDDVSRDDLRIRIPGKHLLRLVRWFETGKNREVGPLREFHEELVQSGYLSADKFAYVRFDFVERQIKRIRYSDYAQSYELLIADVYDVVPNVDQHRELERLQSDSETSDLLWATAERIRRRGAIPGNPHSDRIATTAEWTL
jgi:hypothetical protein